MTEREALKQLIDALDKELPNNMKHIAAGQRFNARIVLAQPEQEPVALMVLEDCGWEFVSGLDGDWIKEIPLGTILYMLTTPPQRTWVELTDEDIALVLTGDASLGTRLDELTPSWIELLKAVEAKLKEKNT